MRLLKPSYSARLAATVSSTRDASFREPASSRTRLPRLVVHFVRSAEISFILSHARSRDLHRALKASGKLSAGNGPPSLSLCLNGAFHSAGEKILRAYVEFSGCEKRPRGMNAHLRNSHFSRGRLSTVSRELRGPRVLLHLFTRQFTMDLTGLAR